MQRYRREQMLFNLTVLGVSLLVLIILLFILFSNADVEAIMENGEPVGLGECYVGLDGWTFCNTFWVKFISYVDVYKDGQFHTRLIILNFQTKEFKGYKVSVIGLTAYIEPPK